MARQSTLTALSGGRYAVIWTDNTATLGDASGDAIHGQIFNSDGTKSGAEFLVDSTTQGDQFEPTVATLTDGRFVVAWRDYSLSADDSSNTAIRAQIFNADGTKSGTEFLANTTTRDDQFLPKVGATSDGGFVISWSDESVTGGDLSLTAIRAQAFLGDGSKVGGEFLVNKTTPNNQINSTVTNLSDGRFVIAWDDESQIGKDTSGYSIRAQIFNADHSRAGSQFVVNTATANYQFGQAVAALANGKFVVTWMDWSGVGKDTYHGIKAQVMNADGTKSGHEMLVNTTTAFEQKDQSVATLKNGNFVIVWADNSASHGGSLYAIKAQIFSGDGVKLGGELQLKPAATGQTITHVTALSDGGFAVTWDGSGPAALYSDNGAPAHTLSHTADIFASVGKLPFLAELAQASYHLDLVGGEIQANHINDPSPAGDAAYWDIYTRIHYMTANDLPDLALTNSNVGDFPRTGLNYGIFTLGNAAALIGRTDDALFVSFRGTNDNGGSTLPSVTPDMSDWITKTSYYEQFSRLIVSLHDYVENAANGIKNVYVVGHSLGASMVQALLTDWQPSDFPGVNIEGTTFASAGYDSAPADDPRLTNIWIAGDPIKLATFVDKTVGDFNTIHTNLVLFDNIQSIFTLHSMKLYEDLTQFIDSNGIKYDNVNLTLHGSKYDSIYASVVVIDEATQLFSVGTGNDTIYASTANAIMLGGRGYDELHGNGGDDYLSGGDQSDFLFGGNGSDYIYGGNGIDHLNGGLGKDILFGGRDADVFVFDSIDNNSAVAADRIGDWGVGGIRDLIDLRAVDAMVGGTLDDAFTFIGSAIFSHVAGELRFSQASGINTLIIGDRDGNGKGDFFITIAGLHTLVGEDFFL